MKQSNSKNIDGLAAIALAGLTTSCAGINHYTDFSYSQQMSVKATSKEEDKRGVEITHGIGLKAGDHRIRTGFHYNSLPDEAKTQDIIIDPKDFSENNSQNSKPIKTELKSNLTSRNDMNISFSLERRMFQINPAAYDGKDLDWFSMAFYLGAGMDFNIQTGKTEYVLGPTEMMDIPLLKFGSIRGFGDTLFELKLGKHPYPIIPFQFGLRICHTGEAFSMVKIGYEVQWGGGK